MDHSRKNLVPEFARCCRGSAVLTVGFVRYPALSQSHPPGSDALKLPLNYQPL